MWEEGKSFHDIYLYQITMMCILKKSMEFILINMRVIKFISCLEIGYAIKFSLYDLNILNQVNMKIMIYNLNNKVTLGLKLVFLYFSYIKN